MELKFSFVEKYLRCTTCFNRTFMELKYKDNPFLEQTVIGFNRTFMELKF